VTETLTLIGASALSIALLSRVGLPAVLGYLFAGILVGPLGFGCRICTTPSNFWEAVLTRTRFERS
jgi:Kef-type K+ transport system membrane component KefB